MARSSQRATTWPFTSLVRLNSDKLDRPPTAHHQPPGIRIAKDPIIPLPHERVHSGQVLNHLVHHRPMKRLTLFVHLLPKHARLDEFGWLQKFVLTIPHLRLAQALDTRGLNFKDVGTLIVPLGALMRITWDPTDQKGHRLTIHITRTKRPEVKPFRLFWCIAQFFCRTLHGSRPARLTWLARFRREFLRGKGRLPSAMFCVPKRQKLDLIRDRTASNRDQSGCVAKTNTHNDSPCLFNRHSNVVVKGFQHRKPNLSIKPYYTPKWVKSQAF